MSYSSIPKSWKSQQKVPILLHKFRRISSIDKQIRDNWRKLLQTKNNQYDENPFYSQQIYSLSKQQSLKQQQQQQDHPPKPQILSTKSIKLKLDMVRQETNLRKKLYDQIYYRKNKINHQPKIGSQSLKIKIGNYPQNKIKTEQNQHAPFFMRNRKKSMQRELKCINNRYQNQIKQVSYQQEHKGGRLWDSQNDLVRKLKNTKFYYHLASSWEPTH